MQDLIFNVKFFAKDVDECTMGLDNCDDNARCMDMDGGFECSCGDGFSGNGMTCNGMNFKCRKDQNAYFLAKFSLQKV